MLQLSLPSALKLTKQGNQHDYNQDNQIFMTVRNKMMSSCRQPKRAVFQTSGLTLLRNLNTYFCKVTFNIILPYSPRPPFIFRY